MSLEIKRAVNPAAVNDSKDVGVAPQFVSILNSKGLEPSVVGSGGNRISPVPLAPLSCYGEPPPCYGRKATKQS